jgi:hypothetical protein
MLRLPPYDVNWGAGSNERQVEQELAHENNRPECSVAQEDSPPLARRATNMLLKRSN